MGSGGGSQKPAAENRFNTGVLTGYVLGPQDLGDSKATEGAALFSNGAGQGIGILPDYADLQAMAGQSYFGGLAGDDPNPILTDALGRVFATPKINMPSVGGGGGFGGGMGGGAIKVDPSQFGNLIPGSAVANSLDYLQNTPSVFDQMSGGPIVDTINQRVNAASDAYTNRQMNNLSRATEISLANDMAQGGFISSSTVLNHREDLSQKVLDDIAVFDATMNLESTKYLGDLAMQDIMNQSHNMEAILQQALIEKGINLDAATKIAIATAEIAKDKAIAQLNAQTQLGVAGINAQTTLQANMQDNALAMLGMGQQDFQNTQEKQLGVATLPLTTLGGLASVGTVGKTPKSP